MDAVEVVETGKFLGREFVRLRVPTSTTMSGGVESVFDASQSDGAIELFPARPCVDYVVSRDDDEAVVVLVGRRPEVPDSISDLRSLSTRLEEYYADLRVVTIRRDREPVAVEISHCNGARWGTAERVEIEAHAVVSAYEVVGRLTAEIGVPFE